MVVATSDAATTLLAIDAGVGVGVVNAVAAVVFAFAFCWRLDQIRRAGWGLQPLAMTLAVTALTLAFVVSADESSAALDEALFTGAARVAFYALLAFGVSALVVVFFFPGQVTRERRAGWEALPLVVALVGLQVTMLLTPVDLRTAPISAWTVQNWGFALFFLIASGYLTYGFAACVRNVGKFFTAAEGYLRVSLGLLMTGLGLLTLSALAQILFVFGAAFEVVRAPWLMTGSRAMAVVGVVAFLVGISYPMAHARVQTVAANRRRRRLDTELLPLWELVTDAVPGVVLPVDGARSPTTRLHRRVVETRDALTQLSPHVPDVFEYAQPEVRARLLQTAATSLTTPGTQHSGAVRDLVPAENGGLEADAAPLVTLSRAVADLDAK